ncbi:MAG: hypothetical protein DHS20C14_01620 [Phycisphaeraceae bacterium]|nr:MAG: hypothetical protein DHS20C14_01620 [Phycisphaeraceae bacterium]
MPAAAIGVLFTLACTAGGQVADCGGPVVATSCVVPPCEDCESSGNPDAPQEGEDSGCNDLSDPIDLATGSYLYEQTDLFVPGRGIDFEFKRMYSSTTNTWQEFRFPQLRRPSGVADAIANEVNPRIPPLFSDLSPMGTGWAHPYFMIGVVWDAQSALDPNEGIQIYHENRVDWYEAQTTDHNAFDSNGRLTGVFSIPNTGLIEYRLADGLIYELEPFEFDEFADLSGPYEGYYRLSSIRDRSGNEITISYKDADPLEPDDIRIDEIVDTLGNVYKFSYDDVDSAYLITSIEDVTGGRTIDYWYQAEDTCKLCSDADTGIVPNDLESGEAPNIVKGQRYDLVSVMLPGTAAAGAFPDLPADHAARFPSGREWTYTYQTVAEDVQYDSEGEECVGRFLESIIDPNGTKIVDNLYMLDPSTPFKSRVFVAEQEHEGRHYNYYYEDATTSGATDLHAETDYLVWVNNRAGQVARVEYNIPNGDSCEDNATRTSCICQPDGRLVRRREYTGLAPNANAVSYGTTNMPAGPIRAGDPPFYDTEFEWNEDWLLSKIIHPNDEFTILERYRDIHDVDLDPLKNGAITQREKWNAAGTDSIAEAWVYDFDFAGCSCAADYPTEHFNALGVKTEFEYDDNTGKLRWIRHDFDSSGNPTAVEEFTYNTYGQMLTHTHPETTVLVSGTPTAYTRTDKYEYDNGYVDKVIIDDGGLNLTYEYEHDAVGNLTKITEPDGDVSVWIYNQYNEIVRYERYDADPDPGPAVLYAAADYFYDANGNLVREDITNLDATQASVGANPELTTIREYDAYNLLERVAVEAGIFSGTVSLRAGPSMAFETDNYVEGAGGYSTPCDERSFNAWSITDLEYDHNDNLSAVVYPEAVDGCQGENRIDLAYDARDRVYTQTEGTGGTELVTQFNYDGKGQVAKIIVDPSGAQPRETVVSWDPFDRIEEITDPMLNEALLGYDDADNLLSVAVIGPPSQDDPTSNDNELLAYSSMQYDEQDRVTAQREYIFDPLPAGVIYSGGSAPPVPYAETAYGYNDDDSVRSVTYPIYDPSGSSSATSNRYYDGAGRLDTVIDAAGNEVRYQYGDGDSLTRIVSVEKPAVGASDQVFHTEFVHDAMDRIIARVEGAHTIAGGASSDGPQNTWDFGWDSRGNLVEILDPRSNLTTLHYDGLSRRVRVEEIMTDTGLGFGTALSPIVTKTRYDDSSRPIELEDSNGNVTRFSYDGLGRSIERVMPDGGIFTFGYDHAGNMDAAIDARGVLSTLTYDLNNRLTGRVLDFASAIDNPAQTTTAETFQYDGLGRVKLATNDSAKIVRSYDSRGYMLSEVLNADAVGLFPAASDRLCATTYDEAGNPTVCTYPGGRVIHRAFDDLNRISSIGTDVGLTDIASYAYVGPGRVEQRTSGNGVVTDYAYNGYEGSAFNNANDLGVGRMAQVTHTGPGSVTVDQRRFWWDRAGNKVAHLDTGGTVATPRNRLFAYDSADRLVQSRELATLPIAPDPWTPSSAPAGGTLYGLDELGNRLAVTGDDQAGAYDGAYTMDTPDDSVNQYTTSPDWEHHYDINGNMVLYHEPCPADINGDFQNNVDDIDAYVALFTAGDPAADRDGNGTINIDDMGDFVADFSGSNATCANTQLSYDYRDQLVTAVSNNGATEVSAALYRYDAFNRRVSKQVTGTNAETTYFVYAGLGAWQLIEEYDGPTDADDLVRTHVYGNYIDEIITTTDESLQTPEDYYYHQDDQFSVYALTDSSGAVIERYDYGDYGEPVVMDAAGLERASSLYAVRHMYTGRLWEPETELYQVRHRFLWPRLGRWVHRDPLGYIDSPNLVAYVLSAPLILLDPYGMRSIWQHYKEGASYFVDILSGRANKEHDRSTTAIQVNQGRNGKKARDRGDRDGANDAVNDGHKWVSDAEKIEQGAMDDTVSTLTECRDTATGAFVPGPPGVGKTFSTAIGKVKNSKFGSYIIDFASGKKYIGKGPKKRMRRSAREKSEAYDDPVIDQQFTPAPNNQEALMDEARAIREAGGVDNPNLYNKINSPGEKLLRQNGE